MHRIAIILVVVLAAAARGDDSSSVPADPTTTTATTTITTTTETTESTSTTSTTEARYSIERPAWIIGRAANTLQTTFPDPDDPSRFWHPWYGPADEEQGWHLFLLRRYDDGSQVDADLLTVIDIAGSNEVVDALLLDYEQPGAVSVGTACTGSFPAILLDRSDNALRAWKVTVDPLTLTEVPLTELTDEEIVNACLQR